MVCEYDHTLVAGMNADMQSFIYMNDCSSSFVVLSRGPECLSPMESFLSYRQNAVDKGIVPSCVPSAESWDPWVVKCDTHQTAQNRGASINNNGLEVSVQDPNARRALAQLQRVLNELRLSRLIRRYRENVRQRLERRCELQQFVVLRIQYLIRMRSRLRAAVRIQRFVRHHCLGPESIDHVRPSTV